MAASDTSQPSVEWKNWQTVGSATLSWGFWTIYDSMLATPDGRYESLGGPLSLSITYRRDIDGEDLLEATGDQWEHLGYEPSAIDSWLKALDGVFPDVVKGDQLIYTLNAGKGTFYFRSKDEDLRQVGAISDPGMANAFAAIWLSPKTSYPKHRLALIGQK
ncbi:hypothetical protein CS022_03205 [Veronia nyctiphanis]|uniref:Chalcone isomerase domain-containing protein n=1 Tax=Veronia nyctiphanis TaxID=1278244 RepID=A0A4Q0YTQ9_9GAMM|nr:hypothetical protein CS022_03205 [Veronia nyctiphanis]